MTDRAPIPDPKTAPRTVRIDCARMTSRAELHDQLAERLGLPDWYGRNLDALFDCLSEASDLRIVVEYPEALAALGGYGDLLLNTLAEAAEANPSLEVEVEVEVEVEGQ